MKKKIKLIIADDNIYFSKQIEKYLKQFNEIEILGIANTDSEEIKMIEELKPDVVISDLMREKNKYSGLDIIKEYSQKESSPYFLVISSDIKEYVINDDDQLKICGYIQKPYFDNSIILKQLKKIIEKIEEE